MSIRQDTEDVHELHDGIVVGIPLVLACEVLMDFVIYLVTYDAQTSGIVRFGVHELRPTELGVLTYLDDVLERGLDEGIEEVNEVVVVAVEEDIAEGEVTVTDSDRHGEF